LNPKNLGGHLYLKRPQFRAEPCRANKLWKKPYCPSYCWVCLQKLFHRHLSRVLDWTIFILCMIISNPFMRNKSNLWLVNHQNTIGPIKNATVGRFQRRFFLNRYAWQGATPTTFEFTTVLPAILVTT
jgi:hypothetical protein